MLLVVRSDSGFNRLTIDLNRLNIAILRYFGG